MQIKNVFLRLFRISGFASGNALNNFYDPDAASGVSSFQQNHYSCKNERRQQMHLIDHHSTPVCVIMEYNAIFVDQFSERLSLLLKELPHDFHFCSLGYS